MRALTRVHLETMMGENEAPELPSDEELLREIEVISQDSKTVQHGVLQRILEKNGPCHYLQRLGLDGRTDIESFKATVPLSSYPDYIADIQRLVDGDTAPLLCCSPPVAFARSSGTSAGTSKYFPVVAGGGKGLQMTHAEAVRRSSFPTKFGPGEGKTCLLYIGGNRQDTRSGLKVTTVITAYVHTEEFRNLYDSAGHFISPIEVVRCSDVQQTIYCHLLCLLIYADVVESITGVFAYSMVECFRSLERLWSSLCHDIRTGEISKAIVTDDVLREVILSKVLQFPMPEIANKVQEECMKGEWRGIILRLIPNLQYLACISTGPMLPFSAVLDRYTRSGFPKLGFGYGCSEGGGHHAFPLKVSLPHPEEFSLWPTHIFYEFLPAIPVEEPVAELSGIGGAVHYQEQEQPVELTEVKLGQQYELLLTTAAGLYRYRVEDIFQVTGFYKSLPIFKFVCRKGVMLSINTDKTDEAELQIVVNKASKILEQQYLDVFLAEYSSYADHSTNPGHYVIYWELEDGCHTARSKEETDLQVFQECCNLMDASLNEPYRRGRKNTFIGPLELRVLRPGTFSNLRNYAVDRGASMAQYKTPRCVVNETLLQILDAGIQHTFHSSFTAWDSTEARGSA